MSIRKKSLIYLALIVFITHLPVITIAENPKTLSTPTASSSLPAGWEKEYEGLTADELATKIKILKEHVKWYPEEAKKENAEEKVKRLGTICNERKEKEFKKKEKDFKKNVLDKPSPKNYEGQRNHIKKLKEFINFYLDNKRGREALDVCEKIKFPPYGKKISEFYKKQGIPNVREQNELIYSLIDIYLSLGETEKAIQLAIATPSDITDGYQGPEDRLTELLGENKPYMTWKQVLTISKRAVEITPESKKEQIKERVSLLVKTHHKSPEQQAYEEQEKEEVIAVSVKYLRAIDNNNLEHLMKLIIDANKIRIKKMLVRVRKIETKPDENKYYNFSVKLFNDKKAEFHYTSDYYSDFVEKRVILPAYIELVKINNQWFVEF